MLLHLASLNYLTALICALKLILGAVVGNVLIHFIQDEVDATVEQASHLAE